MSSTCVLGYYDSFFTFLLSALFASVADAVDFLILNAEKVI